MSKYRPETVQNFAALAALQLCRPRSVCQVVAADGGAGGSRLCRKDLEEINNKQQNWIMSDFSVSLQLLKEVCDVSSLLAVTVLRSNGAPDQYSQEAPQTRQHLLLTEI